MNDYIELDYAGWKGYPRYTHFPSGDTCLHQPYMTTRQWEAKKQEFFAKHPGLIVQDEQGNVIGKSDDFLTGKS